MEDLNVWTQLIGTLGFPIVAYCGVFYLYVKTVKELTVTITKIDATLDRILAHLSIDKKE